MIIAMMMDISLIFLKARSWSIAIPTIKVPMEFLVGLVLIGLVQLVISLIVNEEMPTITIQIGIATSQTHSLLRWLFTCIFQL
jgi:hypothetical protein